jgi:NAD+ synthase/NAD+ synthase (glutamine-hydrolysing)
VKIALCQINPTVGDFSGNSAKIIDFSRRARSLGANLAIFPELSVCGYPARDMVERPAFVQRNQETVEHIAEETRGIAVICGFVTPANGQTGKRVMNSAALLCDGRIAFLQSKMLLPTYDVFDELRNFAPARKQEVLEFCGKRVALTICEDAWNDRGFWRQQLYAVDPVEELARAGANFILNISASPFHLGKIELREEMLAAMAKQYRAPVVMVNQVGGNDSVVFDGSSVVFGPDGKLVASGKSFAEDLVLFDSQTMRAEIHEQTSGREASAYAALVLGTRDYVHKCGFSRAVIGLSGGIDSALVACIAVDALGKENVTGIGLPGPYSSAGSIDDARALASNLGIRYEIVPITPMFEKFSESMEPIFAGKPPDITEENMQSRLRGNVLMAISNKFQSLVLTTGNKSELAVGYSTLYGDMAGAMGVISDVPKTFVYRLAEYVNSRAGRELIPRATIDKPPSAELRPDQKDTDFLPSYEVLDLILEDYVEDLKTVKQISAERGIEKDLVLRVVRMIERSEFKRQQAPIGLKITEKAFGVGRRFPIAAKYEI